MKRLLWIVELSIITLVTLPFLFLPLSSGRVLGLILYYLWRKRRNIAIENVRMACTSGIIKGEPVKIVRKNFEEIGKSVAEMVRIFFGRGKGIISKVRFRGLENLEKAKDKGKGVIFVTGHCGNWELLGIATSSRINPLSVVARKINNPYLNRLVEKIRSRYGNSVIYKKGALKEIIRVLRNNGSVGILMDQAVLPQEGVLVEFLGRPAWTTKMPFLIAKKTGSPILPAFIKNEGKEKVITIYPEVMLLLNNSDSMIEENMRILNSFIENYIKENPEQWLWMHRRWKRTE